jgi:ATP-dependent helicase HepA
MLIADEVGVGKTIEAGLILKELQARREIKSVLIICPKPLGCRAQMAGRNEAFRRTF